MQIISEFLYLLRVAFFIHMSELNEICIAPFDLDLTHIEQYQSCNMKIRSIENNILTCTTILTKMLRKLGYAFKETP